MNDSLRWMQRLADVPGPSGLEHEVKKLLQARLEASAEVTYDNLGSIIFQKTGSSTNPRIMVTSHMDEVGFVIRQITSDGFLRFAPLGRINEHHAIGQRVTIVTREENCQGVIVGQRNENSNALTYQDMLIDIGASSLTEAGEVFGVQPGDYVVPSSQFTVLKGGRILSKALDNRIGCSVMSELVDQLQHVDHPNTVFGVGTVQEEVGIRGAKTVTRLINPDIAFVIDACSAGDVPGESLERNNIQIGRGVVVNIGDDAYIAPRPLVELAAEVGRSNGISFQIGFSQGGTEAARIQTYGEGVPTLVLGIPTKYVHGFNSMAHLEDYQSALNLLRAVVQTVDRQTVAQLISSIHG